jgi:hypothetical protein
MAALELPTEVFSRIFLLISRHQLTSCALVSKLWHAQAIPMLYRDIDLTWSRPIEICDQSADNMHLDACPCELRGICMPEQHDCLDLTVEWWERRHLNMAPCLEDLPCAAETWPLLLALVETLIHSPSLARSVRHLRLTGFVPRSVWTTHHRTGLSNDERLHLRSILPPDSHMSKAGWLRRLDNGCPHAFAALLLICIPDLRSLDLGPRFQDSLQILGPRTLIRVLQHLDVAAVGVSRATVWMGNGRAPFPQADDFPQLLLLYLAEVRSITLNLPRNPYIWSDVVCGALTTRLETLELAFTFLDEHDLARLLQVCSRLREFKYDYWTTPASRDPRGIHSVQYMPDRLSERLVETQVLQSSLDIVRGSLVTLHIHVVPPRDSVNQNLRSIDFSQFGSLTELHVPLQLLVTKDSSRSLADSLPSSLRHLWLNDDASRLWLNHDYIMSPQDYDVEGQANRVDDPSWHPIYTDGEIVDIISCFLSGWRAHVPDLQVLRLLFYHISCSCWDPRDIPYLRNTLEPAGCQAGIDTTVIQVHERPCCHLDRLVSAGQDPPYFTLESIKESHWPHV